MATAIDRKPDLLRRQKAHRGGGRGMAVAVAVTGNREAYTQTRATTAAVAAVTTPTGLTIIHGVFIMVQART